MALTRKLLKGMGLSEEQIDSIIDAHTDSLEGLQNQIKAMQSDADAAKDLKKKLEAYENGTDWKAEHDKVKKELDDYRAEQQNKETLAKKRDAYKTLLQEAKIDPKRVEVILKADREKIEGMTLDKDGKAKDADKITAAIKADWGDFATETVVKGVNPGNPPSKGKGSMSKDEILAIKDTAERQQAIAENHELFGF